MLVVELWTFPDGHAPTRVATPQPFSPLGDHDAGSYTVLRGGLVAAGMLPVIVEGLDVAVTTPHLTWHEATAMCDRMLACLAFTFTHSGPWGGEEDGELRLPVWFKREASPIRIKGAEATANGATVQWTAVKPWRLNKVQTGLGTAHFRECEEWAIDGFCVLLPSFMRNHCGFFCPDV